MQTLLITVLFFIRTDCPVSNSYAPEIERISQAYAARGVRFELVFPDRALTSAQIAQYRRDYSLTVPAKADPDRIFAKRAQIRTTPEAAVFLDGVLVYHGRIDNRFASLGKERHAVSDYSLEEALQSLLSGRKPAQAYQPAIGCALGDLP
jgi:thiol-disulfide isomerase/thioredoxin